MNYSQLESGDALNQEIEASVVVNTNSNANANAEVRQMKYRRYLFRFAVSKNHNQSLELRFVLAYVLRINTIY